MSNLRRLKSGNLLDIATGSTVSQHCAPPEDAEEWWQWAMSLEPVSIGIPGAPAQLPAVSEGLAVARLTNELEVRTLERNAAQAALTRMQQRYAQLEKDYESLRSRR